jgi:hypothetical protein
MRFRTLIAAFFVSFLAVAALALLSPAAAFADDPVALHGADVVDQADVLGSKTADVQAALDKLASNTNLQLFVVYVDSFDNPSDPKQWADATAIDSGLGVNDALLAISVDDKVYRWSVDAAFPLSDSQLASIGTKVEDALHDDDWAGGAITAAQEFEASQAPSPVPLIIGGVVVVGVGGAFAGRAIAKRRAKTKVARAVAADQKALDTQAGTLLVGLDDALKTSEQELGFAQAQFGEDATKDFATALASAQADAKQAFAIQQKLDDAFPETPEDRKTMSQQLIALAQKADATLDAQTAAFDELRQLEKNAPQVLDTVTTTRAGLADRISAAKTKVDGFAARFPGADLTSIEDAPAQAHKLDVFAGTAIEKAKAAITKGPESDAAMAVRVAQQAVGQVEQLLTAVDAREKELAAQQDRNAQSQRQLADELSDARAQIQTTQDFITTHRGAVGSVARTRVSEAQRRIDDATKLGATDPVAALAEAQSAEQLAAQALSSARDDVTSYQSPSGYGGGFLGGVSAGQSSQPVAHYDGTDGATLGGILGTIFGGGGGSSWNSGPMFGSGSNSGSGSGFSWGGGGGSSWHPGGFGGSSSHGGGFGGGSIGGGSSSGSSSGGRRGGGGRF